MKKLAIALITLGIVTQAMALELKTYKGTMAGCNHTADVGNRAYQLSIVKQTKTAVATKLNLKLRLSSCTQTEQGFEFKTIPANAVVKRKYFDSNSGLAVLGSTITDLKLAAYTENGKMVALNHLPDTDAKSIETEITIPHDIGVSQLLIRLNATEQVSTKRSEDIFENNFILAGLYLLNL